MAVNLVPYGKLANGNFGILLDNTTGKPLAATVEVVNSLPPLASADNFPGRLVFETTVQTLFVFQDDPAPFWFPLEGIPAEVDAVAGVPPTTPTPTTGELFFDTDTEVMFVWDGGQWQPFGGRFAARFIEQEITSTGIAGPGGDTFALGTVPTSTEFVEIYLDGTRQAASQYTVIGANVVFPSPVGAGVEVFTRTLESTVLEDPAILQNAQVIESSFVGVSGGLTTFDAGRPALDPAGTFVFKDGLLLIGGGQDYTHQSADTTINTLIKVATTTARATTAAAHGAGVGDVVEILGVLETEFQGSFTITAIPSTTEFEFTVLASAPGVATPDPLIFFQPPFVNDNIVLTTPTIGGEDITIRAVKSLVSAPSTGEANTASNLGTGLGIFSTKSGVDFRFKSLQGGPNITLVDLGSDIQISAASSTLFEDRVGINSALHVLGSTESYIGVRNTSFTVTIDVSTVPSGTSGSGRRVIVQDESGGASANPIQIVHAAATFSGIPSPLTISNNFGSVTIVFDGANWHIVNQN